MLTCRGCAVDNDLTVLLIFSSAGDTCHITETWTYNTDCSIQASGRLQDHNTFPAVFSLVHDISSVCTTLNNILKMSGTQYTKAYFCPVVCFILIKPCSSASSVLEFLKLSNRELASAWTPSGKGTVTTFRFSLCIHENAPCTYQMPEVPLASGYTHGQEILSLFWPRFIFLKATVCVLCILRFLDPFQ